MSRAEDGTLTLEHQKSNFAAMREPLALEWPKDSLPRVLESLSPVVQQLTDKADTQALLRLIHEFAERGEQVSTATTGPAAATRTLRGERGYPKRTPAEVFALLRNAERQGYLKRTDYRTAGRKTREVWEVTPEGETLAELQGAPIAPIARQSTTGATGAFSGRVRAPNALGGVGELARAQTTGATGADGVPADAGAVQTTGAEPSTRRKRHTND